MLINKIHIENFRSYLGKHDIYFNADGKLTVVYGASGSGKTTFLKLLGWVFYDVFLFAINDRPFYNEHLDQQLNIGEEFDVVGDIEFTHRGVTYQIIRKRIYRRSIRGSEQVGNDCILQYKGFDKNWNTYTGNIDEKINEIIPKALSKYFFFHGEEDLGLEKSQNDELKKAIYSLFSIDIYSSAVDHLGEKAAGQSVIGYYAKLRNKYRPDKDANNHLKQASLWKEKGDQHQRNLDKIEKQINELEERRKNLNEIIGQAKLSGSFKSHYETNKFLIKELESNITKSKFDIGNALYMNAPYALLSANMSYSKTKLKEYADNEVTYAGLSRDFLEHLSSSDKCVCGRNLDEDHKDHILKLIDTMPPKSYKYTYSEFVRKYAKRQNEIENGFSSIDSLRESILKAKETIIQLEKDNSKILGKIAEFDGMNDYVKELIHIEKELKTLKTNQGNEISEKNKSISNSKVFMSRYEQAIKDQKQYDIFDQNIDLLEQARKRLSNMLSKRISETTTQLNKNIKEIYKQISTRTDDIDNKKFINDDFTLRTEYKTGGQGTIDAYAYIIGMIKSIKEMQLDEEDELGKEFPLFIDAPFSKTDEFQLSKVINVLPDIVPQAVLFTFDLTRIKTNQENLAMIGSMWKLTADASQTISSIDRGDINAN